MIARLLPGFAALSKQGCFPVSRQGLLEVPVLAGGSPKGRSGLLLLRSFFCHSISLWRKDDWSKKSLTLLPCSSCSVVVKSLYLVSLVRNSQMPGTGKIICSMLRSRRTICRKQGEGEGAVRSCSCQALVSFPRPSCAFPSSLLLHRDPNITGHLSITLQIDPAKAALAVLEEN